MSDDIYGLDIVLWSEQQAGLLRRLSDGEAVHAEIDWVNLIDEVSDVGRSSLRVYRSLLLQAFLYMLKAEAWPRSPNVPHWRSEARVARINAAYAYAPSMRQRIDLDRIYHQALRAMPETVDGGPPLPVPQACPVTLDELLSDDP